MAGARGLRVGARRAGAGALRGVGVAGPWTVRRRRPIARCGRARVFGDRADAVRAIGEAYLRQLGRDPNRESILAAARGALESIDRARDEPSAIQTLVRAVREDFERGRAVQLEGWILSRTEAEICALTLLPAQAYITRQISGLRSLQTDLADRNRKDSLQLLRIQNDLNSLALAMRDMLEATSRYPLTAWSAQFQRIRLDLDDALRRQEEVAVAQQTPEQRRIPGELGRAVLGRLGPNLPAGEEGRRRGSARADPAVAPGAAGGAEHRRRAPAGRRTTRPKS